MHEVDVDDRHLENEGPEVDAAAEDLVEASIGDVRQPVLAGKQRQSVLICSPVANAMKVSQTSISKFVNSDLFKSQS